MKEKVTVGYLQKAILIFALLIHRAQQSRGSGHAVFDDEEEGVFGSKLQAFADDVAVDYGSRVSEM